MPRSTTALKCNGNAAKKEVGVSRFARGSGGELLPLVTGAVASHAGPQNRDGADLAQVAEPLPVPLRRLTCGRGIRWRTRAISWPRLWTLK